ncbi:hypothetical protein ABIB62_004119 [Mucilaginibacter sp. UYP25]|uniref:hypothetical protein n=1 Tax=unclassified Mucilaginibacter TaxID=2617802 RepID=UPI0033911116
MTSQTTILSELFSKIGDDPRVNVWQISLYTALLNLWQQNGFQKEIKVTRKLLMAKAHFRSITTYHKSIKCLKDLGYIVYVPTYDSYQGTSIEIIIKPNAIIAGDMFPNALSNIDQSILH